MGLTQLTQETIERDFCPRCKWYIDKRFIYRDRESGITITMGTVKECKFRTDTSWICDFNEIKDDRLTAKNLCDSCTNTGCEFQSARIECDFYIPPHMETDKFLPIDELYTKADIVAMLKELEYKLYHALCHEIHGKEDCPCTNQTTSCLATFRVCDANRAIGRVIQQKITELKE